MWTALLLHLDRPCFVSFQWIRSTSSMHLMGGERHRIPYIFLMEIYYLVAHSLTKSTFCYTVDYTGWLIGLHHIASERVFGFRVCGSRLKHVFEMQHDFCIWRGRCFMSSIVTSSMVQIQYQLTKVQTCILQGSCHSCSISIDTFQTLPCH